MFYHNAINITSLFILCVVRSHAGHCPTPTFENTYLTLTVLCFTKFYLQCHYKTTIFFFFFTVKSRGSLSLGPNTPLKTEMAILNYFLIFLFFTYSTRVSHQEPKQVTKIKTIQLNYLCQPCDKAEMSHGFRELVTHILLMLSWWISTSCLSLGSGCLIVCFVALIYHNKRKENIAITETRGICMKLP